MLNFKSKTIKVILIGILFIAFANINSIFKVPPLIIFIIFFGISKFIWSYDNNEPSIKDNDNKSKVKEIDSESNKEL